MIPWEKRYNNIYGFEYDFFYLKMLKLRFTVFYSERRGKWVCGGNGLRKKEHFCDTKEEAVEHVKNKFRAIRDEMNMLLDEDLETDKYDFIKKKTHYQ